MADENDTGAVIRLCFFFLTAKLRKIQRREKQAREALQIIHTVAGCASNKLIKRHWSLMPTARSKNWNML